MSNGQETTGVSVIIPVGARHGDAAELYHDYKSGLERLGQPYEFIFVLDGRRPDFLVALRALQADGEHLSIIELTREFGESTALMAGAEISTNEIVVTLPAYHQIQSAEITKLVDALDTADISIGRRYPRVGNAFEKFRRQVFHGLLAKVTHLRFHDLGCSARAMKRRVLEELHLYGDQHRFLAVLADRQGFAVHEIDVRQSDKDRFEGIYTPGEYARRLLDIFTVFFLVRFTKKPLRFFGMIGAGTFGVGALLIMVMVVERLFFDQALASLLVVLGLQLFAIGLLGELIIFTHARDLKDYQVDRVIHFPPEQQNRDTASGGEGGRPADEASASNEYA